LPTRYVEVLFFAENAREVGVSQGAFIANRLEILKWRIYCTWMVIGIRKVQTYYISSVGDKDLHGSASIVRSATLLTESLSPDKIYLDVE
jgi:hypothetical protein